MTKSLGLKIALFLNFFVFAALLNSVGLLVERSQEVYGVSKSAAANLELFKDLSIAAMAFVIGAFLPRIGYKKAMLICLAAVCLGCLYMFSGNSFGAVKVLLAITGLSFAVIKVSVMALIGHIAADKKEHTSLMSLVETIFMLGIVFMFVVFPLFYSDTNPDGWLNGFLFMAALLAISFIILLFIPFDIDVSKKETVGESIHKMFQLFSKPIIWVFAIFAFFYVMTEQGIMSWLPTFNKETLNLGAKLGTQMAVLLMLSTAAGRFLTSFLSKKIKWVYINYAGVIGAIILVLLVLPLAKQVEVREINSFKDLPAVSYLFPLIGFFLAPLYPLVNSTVLSSTDKSIHSSLAGILTFFSAIGGTLGSLIVGNLFDTIGGEKVFYLSLIPFVIIFITFFFINRFTTQAN